jgi:hypothetical protein
MDLDDDNIKSSDFEVSMNIFKSFMGIAITTFCKKSLILAYNMLNGGLFAGLIIYPLCTLIVYFTITLSLEVGISKKSKFKIFLIFI